jgi:hypothetical protein
LTWLDERGSVQQVAPIFKIVAAMFLLYIVVDYALTFSFYLLVSKYLEAASNEYNPSAYQTAVLMSSNT